MNKMKESISQFQQSMQQQLPSSSPPRVATSLDYLYQAISLIETKNNNNINSNANSNGHNSSANSTQFFNINQQQQQQLSASSQHIGNTKSSMNLLGSAAAHQSLLNQQSLINSAINSEQAKRYNSLTQQFTSTEQMNQLYHHAQQQQQQQNQSAQMDQSQFSVVDCRRYFNNLLYQQQLQRSQQQQQKQQGNCTDPYCNCLNKSGISSSLPKYNTIHNIIGQQQQQQQQQQNYQQQQQMSNLSSSLQKFAKSPSLGKVMKQQRQRTESEKANERRISNLIQLSQKSAGTGASTHQIPAQQSQAQSKKNISKLLQTGSLTNDLAIINNENDFLTKKAIPSRLEKAKQLARKHQSSLKLSLNTPDIQIIERDGLLTPLSSLSTSSVSPMSQAGSLSPISPQYSPSMPQQQQLTHPGQQGTNSNAASQQPSAFSYYPVEMMNNLIPLYLTPYLNNLSSTPGNSIPSGSAPMTPTTPSSSAPNFYQLPSPATNTGLATSNIDQLYFQNLVTAIYTIANYQQQQQQQQQPLNINQNTPSGLNLQRQTSFLPNLPFNGAKQQNMFNMGSMSQQQQPQQPQQASFHQQQHQQQIQPKTNISYPIQAAVNGHMSMPMTTHHRATDLIANKSEMNTNNKPKHLSLNLKENKPESTKPAAQKQTMDLPKTQTLSRKAPRSTFSYKLISYIGADIEAKVDEHFRRSLGIRYNKAASTLPTKQASNLSDDKGDHKDTSENTTSNEETSDLNAKSSFGCSSCEAKLVINELELEEENENTHTNTAEEKHPQSKDWNNNDITGNMNDYCDCSSYDCNHLEHGEASASAPSAPEQESPATGKPVASEGGLNGETTAISEADSPQYDDEFIEYESDEHLIDYSNDEVLASNPVSPVSTASYSYSVISQTSDMIPEESACSSSGQTVLDASEQPVMDVMSSMLANKQIISSL